MIDRRQLVAGLAAVTVAGVALPRRPIQLHKQLAPVLPAKTAAEFRPALPILKAATWHYQSLEGSGLDLQGVIRHLPSGFTFWTFLAPETHWDGVDFWRDFRLAVHPLFAKDEALPRDLATHHAIARAASHAATTAEDMDGGCIYVLPLWVEDIAEPRAAPPLIADGSSRDVLMVFPT
jgi:hypothetical protein